MSLLTDALDRIETWLVKHQPEFAFYIDDEGYVEKDTQRVAEIQRKYNYRGREKSTPKESYNPDLPTAASEVDLSNPNALEELIQALQTPPLSPDANSSSACKTQIFLCEPKQHGRWQNLEIIELLNH